MNKMRGHDDTEPKIPHPGALAVPRHAPLSLRAITLQPEDDRPAFPGDPDMDWQNEPERPPVQKWGLRTPASW